MFWPISRHSAASSVDRILDKEHFTLEEILDEEEIIQECKALNFRLVNFLGDKTQVEQLLHYIVEEAPNDSEKQRSFKFPLIACEIFTCEIDIILTTLVEDEQLMDLLFSFVKYDHPHSPLLAGYFSKVVTCLMMRKTAPIMNYVQRHSDIFVQLVDLIGISSIMEVLIRLIGADKTIYSNHCDVLHWFENVDILDMVADKFSSSDSPEIHANAAEILSSVTRCAPPALATKVCSPSFIENLFRHGLEESRPKSVLVHSLSVCISLLDTKRLASASYQAFRSNLSHGTMVTATSETVDVMLDSLGDLLKLTDISSSDNVLPTTYGCLRPPLGKHRLKIVEFISVLLTIGGKNAEMELINQSAIKHCIDLFFQYPYNNFLHHLVENIIISCLEAKRVQLIDHVLIDCDLVGKILATEKNSSLLSDSSVTTLPSKGKAPPKIGNIGHITRIANKLIQLKNNNSTIQSHLQENNEWVEWQTTVLVKRNDMENVHHWVCGRPTSLHDRGRDIDDDDFQDRDYDVQAIANSLRQAFRYGTYNNDDIEEDVDFDDEAAEILICSLPLGDERGSSIFTNSDWYFDGDEGMSDRLAALFSSSSPGSEGASLNRVEIDEVVIGEATTVDDSQQGSVPRENDPALEQAEVPEYTVCSKDMCTEEEDRSRDAERHPGARDHWDGAPAEDVGMASCGEAGTARTAVDESAGSSDAVVASSDTDTGSWSHAEEDHLRVEVHGENRTNKPSTNE